MRQSIQEEAARSGRAARKNPPDAPSALQDLGADRVEALLVAFLARHAAGTTGDIMDATGLRQPEISVGMRRLMERGWVSQDILPRRGKGRPMHLYERTLKQQDMLNHYLEKGRARVDRLKSSMVALQASWP